MGSFHLKIDITYIKTNLIAFIFFFLIVLLGFHLTSYNFFISNFTQLEKEQNQNNINVIISGVKRKLDRMDSVMSDYSKWDDSYSFVVNPNDAYINENFREGTTTLEDLGIDFIVYSNLKDEVVYSKFILPFLKKNKNEFENKILVQFQNNHTLQTLFKFKSQYFYLVRKEIVRSDMLGKPNGYIFSGKLISDESLNKLSQVYDKLYIYPQHSKDKKFKLHKQYFENTKIQTEYENNKIKNTVQLFDIHNKFVFSVVAINPRDIVDKGKETIYFFNLVISVFLFVIFYFVYKNQNSLEKYNRMLEVKVNRRTSQLNKSLRKLKGKNRELYTLANVDFLTNIRNRRNYFKESERALVKCINKEVSFYVLMIDIDHFKKINDTYGHALGDKVLIEFCTIITSTIDEKSIFGRIGGEEFCITFIGKSIDEVELIAEDLRIKCEKSMIKIDNAEINFTVSMGLSEKNTLTNIDEILQAADDLLYQAKEEGRNRIVRVR